MVMHARKLPRLSDGYFDRNQPHPYQQNSSKYSKGGYNDRYNDKMRDSPNNGTAYRSESPESSRPSPRDRTYHNKASYLQRIKERDKRDKDSSKSPKDKLKIGASRDHNAFVHHNSDSTCSNSNENRSNHIGRSTTSVEDKDKERKLQVGEWSEHISSSGKKYYYNCKTEVSQWEKPKEWIEWERQQGKLYDCNKFKDANPDKAVTEKHSNDRGSRSLAHCHPSGPRSHDERHHSKNAMQTSCASVSSRSATLSQNDHPQRNCQQPVKEDQVRHGDKNEHRSSRDHGRQDCDYRTKSRKSSEDSQTQDMDISSDSTPPGSQSDSQSQTPVSFTNQTNQQSYSTSQQTPPPVGSTSLANLPRLLSQLTGSKVIPIHEKQELSAHEALQTLQTALLLTRQVTLAHNSLPGQSPHSGCAQPDLSPFPAQRSPVPASSLSQPQTLSYACMESKRRTEEERERGGTSPSSEYSHKSSRRDSPTSSISSLQGITSAGMTSLASAALRPAVITLSSSLANHFREDLLGHIMGWQADHAERQANKYSEEAHNLGNLTCTKVSAELKSTRSLVRVSEIQATLQEQRILFLRQQIKELEDWKSQNSFMCDS